MITSLGGVVRMLPFFPLIGTGESVHQPVCVTDLAECVAACLIHDAAIGN